MTLTIHTKGQFNYRNLYVTEAFAKAIIAKFGSKVVRDITYVILPTKDYYSAIKNIIDKRI